jgi:hypothetical protein
MSTFLWIVLAMLYLAALAMLGLSALRKGHTLLFWFGIFRSRTSTRMAWRGPRRSARSPRTATGYGT